MQAAVPTVWWCAVAGRPASCTIVYLYTSAMANMDKLRSGRSFGRDVRSTVIVRNHGHHHLAAWRLEEGRAAVSASWLPHAACNNPARAFSSSLSPASASLWHGHPLTALDSVPAPEVALGEVYHHHDHLHHEYRKRDLLLVVSCTTSTASRQQTTCKRLAVNSYKE